VNDADEYVSSTDHNDELMAGQHRDAPRLADLTASRFADGVAGHEHRFVLHSDPDDTPGYARCSCGWESQTIKACNINAVFA
jgi:hypothetical protein